MKCVLVFFALPLTWLVIAPADVAFSQTQAELTRQAANEFKAADADLNRVYKALLAKLDDEGRAKLVAAQRAWITFRDAEAAYEADTLRGGSAQEMTRWGVMASLTQERTKTLKNSLENDNSDR
ncbi:MAG: DUF1311 domain-containing protein [Verrucomicrobia bacterium]|nr:DUF1311 domain-containing protein [Verrucomicrobiota bacterium]